jgi:hypothetical protein
MDQASEAVIDTRPAHPSLLRDIALGAPARVVLVDELIAVVVEAIAHLDLVASVAGVGTAIEGA